MLRSKNLNKSATLMTATSSSSVPLSASGLKSTRSKSSKNNDTKSLLATTSSTSLENVEIEYIKNLQQQVYFLELECNYLRQQLNLSGLNGTTNRTAEEIKSQELKMSSLSRTADAEKETVLQVLEQTERNFHKERELLLKEISTLKRQKTDLEESLINKSVEMTKIQENLEKHHVSAHHTVHQSSKIESIMESLRKDNQLLRTEINDARTKLISRDNHIKDLQDQLNEPKRKQTLHVSDEIKSTLSQMTQKLTQTNEALTKEAVLTQQLTDENFALRSESEAYSKKVKELSKENEKLSTLVETSLKQNESDLLLAKKNAEHSKASIDKLTNDLDSERLLNHNLKAQIEQFKLTERLEMKNINSLKTRVRELEEALANTSQTHDGLTKNLQEQLKAKQAELDETKSKHLIETESLQAANKSLEQKINELNDTVDNLQSTHRVQNESTKTRLNEMQSSLDEHSLNLANEKNNSKNLQMSIETFKRQEEIHTNLIASLKVRVNELEVQLADLAVREPSLANQLRDAETRIFSLESEKEQQANEINNLQLKLERLKGVEEVLKSHKWNEFGQLAESIKNLSLNKD